MADGVNVELDLFCMEDEQNCAVLGISPHVVHATVRNKDERVPKTQHRRGWAGWRVMIEEANTVFKPVSKSGVTLKWAIPNSSLPVHRGPKIEFSLRKVDIFTTGTLRHFFK